MKLRKPISSTRTHTRVGGDTAYRLWWLVFIAALLFFFGIALQVVEYAVTGSSIIPLDGPMMAGRALGLVSSIGFLWIIATRGWSERRLLAVAPTYEILGAFSIAMTEVMFRSRLGGPMLVSWVPVWILLFRVFVPYRLGRAIWTTIGSMAALPLTALALDAGGLPVDWPPLVMTTVMSSAIAAAAVFHSQLLLGLMVEVQQARELGSYELVEEIGRGGMGVVYRARHRLLKRQAAIKVIANPQGVGLIDKEALERFEREAQATATLRSPNTIEVYDFGQADGGAFYYVMELLDGVDLSQLVKRTGPLNASRTIHVLRQACRSLGEAHAAGMVHRDIKPANLFLCRQGPELDVVKVMDFGLVGDLTDLSTGGELTESLRSLFADADGKLTQVGAICGTPGYLAPEVCRGERAGPRSDLYALGCVGYWLLTGERVFPEATPWATMLAHMEKDPPRMSGVQRDLGDLLYDCLSRDPSERPADADELDRRLGACRVAPWTREDAVRCWKRLEA